MYIFNVDRYWIPKQGDKDMLNDGKVVTLNGPKTKTLKTKKGKKIAKVSKTTYEVSIFFYLFFLISPFNLRYFLLEIPNGRHRASRKRYYGQFGFRKEHFSQSEPKEGTLWPRYIKKKERL
jgi:hypothetical protein